MFNSSSAFGLNELKRIRQNRLAVKKTKKRNLLNLCRNCKKDTLYENNGLIICSKCGLFSNVKVDMDQESYNYNDGKADPTRTNMVENYLIPSCNKGSIYSYNCANGNKKNIGHNNMIRNMNNWKIMDYKDSNRLHLFNNIASICNNAGISSLIIENAKEIFYKIHNIHSPRRSKLSALLASSVIISFKKIGQSYNFSDIATMFNITKKVLRTMLNEYERYWKEICDKEQREQIKLAKASLDEDNKNGDIVIERIYKQKKMNDMPNYKHYLSMLNIDVKYVNKLEILDSWIHKNKILLEHVPKSVIACVIFMCFNLYNINIKKKQIATVCGTSVITINKCYTKLMKYQDEIIKLLEN